MKFYSPCQYMTEEAKLLPKDKNIKLFLRHSIRYEPVGNQTMESLLLTPEGIELARKIGKSLDWPVGDLYASTITRAQQTVQYIAEGAGCSDKKITLCDEYVFPLGFRYAADVNHVGWYEYFHLLQIRDTKRINVTLKDEVKPMLDRIFKDEGKPGTLDLIGSHDGHVIMLASALFDLKNGSKGDNWCEYTEGIFFYGCRSDFYAIWRGETRRFKDFYM